jgi:hypothetical protein
VKKININFFMLGVMIASNTATAAFCPVPTTNFGTDGPIIKVTAPNGNHITGLGESTSSITVTVNDGLTMENIDNPSGGVTVFDTQCGGNKIDNSGAWAYQYWDFGDGCGSVLTKENSPTGSCPNGAPRYKYNLTSTGQCSKTGMFVGHAYSSPGTYKVRLSSAEDSNTDSSSYHCLTGSVTVDVVAPPPIDPTPPSAPPSGGSTSSTTGSRVPILNLLLQ